MRTAPAALAVLLCILSGCASRKTAERLDRRGDEIVICGQLYHTGAPVVLWTDPGGYDAYRTELRFAPRDPSEWTPEGAVKTPARYNQRTAGLTTEETERTPGGGWDLPTLQRTVDQF